MKTLLLAPKQAACCLLLLLFALAFTTTGSAQQMGGTEPGQQLPHTVEPANLAGSSYGGNVNLFTGNYNGTHALGTVGTPAGLSFTLNLSYTSRTGAGNVAPLTQGIPYGEGWQADLPTISVRTEAYETYRQGRNSTCIMQAAANTGNNDTANFHFNEGQLYWYNPVVSIPGMEGGRAIFKEFDGSTAVFVCNSFGSYTELHLSGSTWEAHLEDGTVYAFTLAQKSYRAGANQRILDYGTGISTDPNDNTKMAAAQAELLREQVLPKGEYLTWYCTSISNKNMPNGQQIRFQYHTYGQFNYFAALSEAQQPVLATSLTEEFNRTGGEAFEYPFNLPDLVVFTDVFLKRVESTDGHTVTKRIELNYRTQEHLLDGAADMLNWHHSNVHRLDSLYSFTSVYAAGSSSAYTHVGSASNFSSWHRYLHAMHDDVQAVSTGIRPTDSNPYVGLYGGNTYLHRSTTTSSSSLSFDHGYLESPPIANLVPGDVYELRTAIHGQSFCNFDLDVQAVSGAGPSSTSTFTANGETVSRITPTQQGAFTRQSLYSTFNNAVKWNPQSSNADAVVTSSLFSMPNLPDAAGSAVLQIGPANSDNLYSAPLDAVSDGVGSNQFGNAFKSYHAALQNNLYVTINQTLKSTDHVPANFGLGLPWQQMQKVYDRLVGLDYSTVQSKWWNDVNAGTHPWNNTPTQTGNTSLRAVELLRYSKNALLLDHVDVYSGNGTFDGVADAGLKHTGRIELEYERQTRVLPDNRHYAPGDSPVAHSTHRQHLFLLTAIKQVPVNPSQNAAHTGSAPAETSWPTVHFEYNNLGEFYAQAVAVPQIDYINGQPDTTWVADTVWANVPGRVLTRIQNHLGSITRIAYHPLQTGSKSTVSSRKRARLQCSTGSGLPLTPEANAMEASYVVKNVRAQDRSSQQKTTYAFGNYVNKNLVPGVDARHFQQQIAYWQYGFDSVTVTMPELNGLRPYTVYRHSSDYHTFGKLLMVRKYNHSGQLQERTDIEWKATLAFENGTVRPEYRAQARAWDYLDYHPTHQTYRPPTPVVDLSLVRIRPEPSLAMQVTPRTGTFSYYPLLGGAQQADANHQHAWFVRKVRETNTRYNTATCSSTSTDTLTYTELGHNDYKPPKSYSNTATNTNEGDLIQLMRTSHLQEPVIASLLQNSPLSEAVLLTAVTEPLVQASTLVEILSTQPGLSDNVLTDLFAHPTLTDNQLAEILAALPHYLSKDAMHLLVQRFANRPPENTVVVDVLLAQPGVPDPVQRALVAENHLVPLSQVTTILSKQTYRTDQLLLDILDRKHPMSDADLLSLIQWRTPYVGDAVLIKVCQVGSDALVQGVLSNDPDPMSQAVWNAFDASDRPHALIELIGKIDADKHLQNPIPLNQQCSGSPTALAITNITEYEYFDADERGRTTSEGWRQLMGLTTDTIWLQYEPSWKLYRTRSYSPQYAGAYSEQEQFYLYDLKNRYLRNLAHYPSGHGFTQGFDTLFTGYLLDITTDSIWNAQLQDWIPIVLEINYQFDTTFVPVVLQNGSKYEAPRADGLTMSRDKGLRNMVFQQRTTTKNNRDAAPLERSQYFEYDYRWNNVPDIALTRDTLPADTTCTAWSTNSSTDIEQYGCQRYKYINNNFSEVPEGFAVYEVVDTVYYYYGIDIYGDTTLNQVTGSNGYWMCPVGALDLNDATISLVYYNGQTVTLPETIQQSPYVPDVAKAALQSNVLKGKVLMLRNAAVQLDTLKRKDYNSWANGVRPLMDFVDAGGETTEGYPLVFAWYPYDSLETVRVLKRNRYGQVVLEQNARALKTRYHFAAKSRSYHWHPQCPLESYASFANHTPGMPIAVTRGSGRADSLYTTYTYHPDLSIATITDPNNTVASFAYDAYGRLEASYRNNQLVSRNTYAWWNNDTTLSFDSIATLNHVETALFLNDGDSLAEVGWAWLDPLGRSYHTASQVQPNYFTGLVSDQMAHTGIIEYDAWNRTTKTVKPFVHTASGPVPKATRLSTTDPTNYPAACSEATYENDHFGRPLKTAKPGETLTGHTVDNSYVLVNGQCLVCELGLSNELTLELMPDTLTNYVFARVQTTDEDNKTTYSYTNALGQQVAQRSILTPGPAPSGGEAQAITLFLYDSYGNLCKTINPEGQPSHYRYNILGQLYEQETVDGGRTRTMYNRTGQPVLEQDANAAAGLHVDDATPAGEPYFRQYQYDAYNRPVRQQKVRLTQPTSHHALSPLLYANLETGTRVATGSDPQTDYWVRYRFTNNSTYAWKAQATRQVAGWYIDDTLNYQLVAQLGFPVLEKEWHYNQTVDANGLPPGLETGTLHQNMLPYLQSGWPAPSGVEGRANLRGRLSHTAVYDNKHQNNAYPDSAQGQQPVQRCFYSYNSDGELAWQLEQFNPNRISPATKGLVARIDYPDYNTRGSLQTQNIDINNDGVREVQYHYTYDGYNRLRDVYLNLNDAKAEGHLLARHYYDDALGLLTRTEYYRPCQLDLDSAIVDTTVYIDRLDNTFDVRDRLTAMYSTLYRQTLLYDGQAVTAAGTVALNAHTNHNGNINGTQHDYRLFNATNDPGNFDTPTWYAFEYDGLNRLTAADAYVGDIVAAHGNNGLPVGDVTYTFDKIGNLKTLTRQLTTFNGPTPNRQEWEYTYQPGTNRLLGVTDAYGQDHRTYAYDAAGNLLADDYRHLTQTSYGRANLPTRLTAGTKRIDYIYSASDARIYKARTTTMQLRPTPQAEYYLTNAQGQTLGILDVNRGAWTWYAFGKNRFAKFTPEADQQPELFATDWSNETAIGQLPNDYTEVKLALLHEQQQGRGYPQKLISVRYAAGSVKITTENDLNDQLQANPSLAYEIIDEAIIKSTDEHMRFANASTGKTTDIKLDELLASGSALDSATIDTSVVDTAAGFYKNTSLTELVFYVHDHLGNTRVTYKPIPECYLDRNDNRVIIRADFELENVVDYYPYGKVLREYQADGEEKFLTTHHERDGETGFDYRGARFYDADVGRFLSLDPEARTYPGLSDFCYVAANPIAFVDPDGRKLKLKLVDTDASQAESTLNSMSRAYDFSVNKNGKVTGYTLKEGMTEADASVFDQTVIDAINTGNHKVNVVNTDGNILIVQHSTMDIGDIDKLAQEDKGFAAARLGNLLTAQEEGVIEARNKELAIIQDEYEIVDYSNDRTRKNIPLTALRDDRGKSVKVNDRPAQLFSYGGVEILVGTKQDRRTVVGSGAVQVVKKTVQHLEYDFHRGQNFERVELAPR